MADEPQYLHGVDLIVPNPMQKGLGEYAGDRTGDQPPIGAAEGVEHAFGGLGEPNYAPVDK